MSESQFLFIEAVRGVITEKGPQTAEQLCAELRLPKKRVNRILYARNTIDFISDGDQPPKWNVLEPTNAASGQLRRLLAARSHLEGSPKGGGKTEKTQPSINAEDSFKDWQFGFPIDQLRLKKRTQTVLRRQGVKRLGELVSLDATTIRKFSGAGTVVLDDISRELDRLGLRLGMPVKRAETTAQLPEEKTLIRYLFENPGISFDKCAYRFEITEIDVKQILSLKYGTDVNEIRRKLAAEFCEELNYSFEKFELEVAESATAGGAFLDVFLARSQIPEDKSLTLLCCYFGVEQDLSGAALELSKKVRADAKRLRAKLAVARRFEGHTLQEIGAELGVTRERARQIIEREIGKVDFSKDARRKNRISRVIDSIERHILESKKCFPIPKELVASVNDLLDSDREASDVSKAIDNLARELRKLLESKPGLGEEDLLNETGLSSSQVRKIDPSGARRLTIESRGKIASKWTDDDLLVLLRRAATYHFPLTGPKWDHLIAVGELDAPSAQLVFKRFGSWSRACELAGVEFVHGVRHDYGRNWSIRDLERIVVEYLVREESAGTLRDFEVWLASKDGYPSSQTVRNYLGPWSTMKANALLSPLMKRRLEDD